MNPVSDPSDREELGQSRRAATGLAVAMAVIIVLQGAGRGFDMAWLGIAALEVLATVGVAFVLMRFGVAAGSEHLVVTNPLRRHVLAWSDIEGLRPKEPGWGPIYVQVRHRRNVRIFQAPFPGSEDRRRLYEIVAERSGGAGDEPEEPSGPDP